MSQTLGPLNLRAGLSGQAFSSSQLISMILASEEAVHNLKKTIDIQSHSMPSSAGQFHSHSPIKNYSNNSNIRGAITDNTVMRDRKDVRNKRKQKWSLFLNEINYQPPCISLSNTHKERNDSKGHQTITLTPSRTYVSPNKGLSQKTPTQAVDHHFQSNISTKPFEANSASSLPIKPVVPPIIAAVIPQILAPSVVSFNSSLHEKSAVSSSKPHLSISTFTQPPEPFKALSIATTNSRKLFFYLFQYKKMLIWLQLHNLNR